VGNARISIAGLRLATFLIRSLDEAKDMKRFTTREASEQISEAFDALAREFLR